MKPYSVEFREKIVKAYEQKDTSIRKLASRFDVSKSLDFNPIELWWSQLKAFLRCFSPTTTRKVDILIATALDLINPQHLKNWFAKCCYCHP